MPAPRLPARHRDAWECGFLFDAPREVRSVSAGGGLVVAGGAELHLVRPGAQRMASRAPPLDLGPIHVAAAEPRAPFRYAVASGDLVAVFFRTPDGEQVVRLRCAPAGTTGDPRRVPQTPPGPSATHLAWGRDGAQSALYIRWSDGAVVRMKQDLSSVDTPDLPPMDAIAADEDGVLALISFAAPSAYVTEDGENLDLRALAPPVASDGAPPTYLAVAGRAVAFSAAGGAFVSRAPDAPFVPCPDLATAGPLAFEGPSPGAALFGAVNQPARTSILRIGGDGDAARIADFGADAGPTPEITALAWDGSRRMIWAGSPQMGLVTCTAPGAKGKKAVLS
jgi:hypothetical protein